MLTLVDNFGRRLPMLSYKASPDRLAQQLEQWRASEAQERERQIRSELRDFTDITGIGLGI